MKRIILIAAAVAVASTAAIAWAQFNGPLVEFPGAKGIARAGACAFPIGGWVIVNPDTSTAASSSALNKMSRYVAQCRVDSYIAFGDESTDAADANDGYLPQGTWLEFVTTDSVRYVSFLNIGSDSDCRIIECL